MSDHHTLPATSLPVETGRRSPLLGLTRTLALLVLAVSALAYPLQFPVSWLRAMFGEIPVLPISYGFLAGLRAYFLFGYSPLVLKEVLTSWCIFSLLAAWLTWKLFASHRRREPFRPEIWALLAFLAYSLASMLWAPHFGLDYHCIQTGMNLCLWVMFGIVLIDLPPSDRFRKASIACILSIGGVLMLVSIGQAVSSISVYVFQFMNRFEGQYGRNLYGSLIGHNTGVASICMGPFFFAVGGLFGARSWKARTLLTIYILISIFFFIVTQSRAIWILLMILTPLFLLGLRPLIGAPVRFRHFLIGALIALGLIASQAFPHRFNFLRIQRSDYLVRLRSLSPDILVKGTRLRILMASGSLIAQRPFFGHGLGSFSIMYPKAQGDYFAAHPDTRLAATANHTIRAHNDYLQLLVETGAAGVFLAALAAFLFLRRALLRFRRLKSDPERLYRYSAFFSAAAMALHAFVDFPFHIAPLAAFFIFYAAAIYGSAKEDTLPAESEEAYSERTSDAAPARKWNAIRPLKILSLVFLFGIWALALYPASFTPTGFTARRLLADRLFTTGAQLFHSGIEVPASQRDEQIRFFEIARKYMRQSRHVAGLESLTLQYLAQCDTNLSRLCLLKANEAQSQGETNQALEWRRIALSHAESSLEELRSWTRTARASDIFPNLPDPENALGPRANHAALHNLASNCLLLEDLKPGSAQRVRLAAEYLRLSIRYSPAWGEAYVDLLDLLQTRQWGDAAEQTRLIRLMSIHAPATFHAYCSEQTKRLLQRGQAASAAERLRHALEAASRPADFPELFSYLGWIHAIYAPDAEKLREHIAFLETHIPKHPDLMYFKIWLLAAQGQLEPAEKALADLRRKNPNAGVLWNVLHAELLMRLGEIEQGKDIFQQTARLIPFPWGVYRNRGHVRRALGGRGDWEDDYQEVLQAFPPEFELAGLFFALLKAQAERGDWEAFRRTQGLAELRLPTNTAIKRYAEKLRTQPDADP